ncbi:unnamed protein product [Urochloa humidicola]
MHPEHPGVERRGSDPPLVLGLGGRGGQGEAPWEALMWLTGRRPRIGGSCPNTSPAMQQAHLEDRRRYSPSRKRNVRLELIPPMVGIHLMRWSSHIRSKGLRAAGG